MIRIIKFICQLLRLDWKIEESHYSDSDGKLYYQIDFGRRQSLSAGYSVIHPTDKFIQFPRRPELGHWAYNPNYQFDAWVIMLRLCFRWILTER